VFIRFQGAILLMVLTAVAESVVEKSILDHRRSLSQQHFRVEVLRERLARLRLETERLSSPAKLARPVEKGSLDVFPGRTEREAGGRAPLLHWRIDPGWSE
jgi:hypothetical protein